MKLYCSYQPLNYALLLTRNQHTSLTEYNKWINDPDEH